MGDSTFVGDLRSALIASHIAPEMTVTIKVGVMSAGGMSRADIVDGLKAAGHDVDELDVKMALRRLQRIARDWQTEAMTDPPEIVTVAT